MVQPAALHLTRSDPGRNMARYYRLCLQPTLFGEVVLWRQWGRIGTKGQSRIETFADASSARAAQDRLERVKRRRGYADGAQ